MDVVQDDGENAGGMETRVMDEQQHREPPLRERLPDESNRAYLALLDYCRLGSGRSMLKLAAMYKDRLAASRAEARDPETPRRVPVPPTTCHRTLKKWSYRYGWQDAAREWDRQTAELEQVLWTERRLAEREREWALGSLMLERAQQALLLGVYYEDGEIAGIKLPEIKASDIPKLADIGSKLARLAAGDTTDSVEVRTDGLTDSERAARIAAVLERARARRAGQAVEGDQPE